MNKNTSFWNAYLINYDNDYLLKTIISVWFTLLFPPPLVMKIKICWRKESLEFVLLFLGIDWERLLYKLSGSPTLVWNLTGLRVFQIFIPKLQYICITFFWKMQTLTISTFNFDQTWFPFFESGMILNLCAFELMKYQTVLFQTILSFWQTRYIFPAYFTNSTKRKKSELKTPCKEPHKRYNINLLSEILKDLIDLIVIWREIHLAHST